MVGWSRRNAESAERKRKFNEWYAGLSDREKVEYYEKKRDAAIQKEDKIAFIVLLTMIAALAILAMVNS